MLVQMNWIIAFYRGLDFLSSGKISASQTSVYYMITLLAVKKYVAYQKTDTTCKEASW